MTAYPPPGPLRLPTYRPRVTYVIMGLLVVVFALETLAGGSEKSPVLIELGANVGPLVTAGEYWRIITANFLHIGLMHIVFNLYALYVVGPEVEMFYGPIRFSVIYLFSALSGAVASYAFTYGLSAGASTALFGLIGTLVAFFTRNRSVFGEMGRARLGNLAVIIVINVILGLSPGASIDNWGHIGGFIGGAIMGWLLCPFYQIEAQADGARRVVDRNSVRVEWIGLVLSALLLVVAFWATLQYHQAQPMAVFLK